MEQQETIRVMIVDDHLMVRDGLKVFLSGYADIEVVGEAGDGAQAVASCRQVKPDVILMDLVMPVMDGPDATAQIRAECPSVQVIALTSFADGDLVARAIQAGAIGYVFKDAQADRLTEVIRKASRGRATIDPAATQALVEMAQTPASVGSDLTRREQEILARLVEGRSNKQIAEDLVISLGTVRFHVSNIIAKLGVSNRTQAVSLALQKGLLEKD